MLTFEALRTLLSADPRCGHKWRITLTLSKADENGSGKFCLFPFQGRRVSTPHKAPFKLTYQSSMGEKERRDESMPNSPATSS